MWPVRKRRGTRKRCAALFIIGLCAAIMVFTRPFITTQMVQQLTDDIVVVMPPASQLIGFTGGSINATDIPLSPEPDLIGIVTSADININSNVANGTNKVWDVASMDTSTESIKKKPVVVIMSKEQSVNNTNLTISSSVGSPTTTTTTNISSSVTEAITTNIVTSTPSTLPPSTTEMATSQSGRHPINPVIIPVKDVPFAQLPTIYVITPTFPRMEQLPELTRLGQTLMHVRKLVWIVADDAARKSADVEALLHQLRLNATYILGAMPDAYRKRKGNKPKGVANRMAGIQWIRRNADNNGVMFFADDDNSYDIRLFEEMRWTKVVSMWPVGLITQLGISTPVVRDGKVIDFYDGWIASRKFPVDMAGFAVNVGFLRSRPKAAMPFRAGFEEDGFLRSLNITLADIEPKADNCTKIYVWHTRTVSNKVPQKISAKDRQKFNHTNLFHLPYIV